MTDDLKKLPESELAIMIYIWQAVDSNQSVTTAYLIQKLENNHRWAKTTLLNFLTRLVERGYLEVTKNGRNNQYYPLITQHEYIRSCGNSLMMQMFSGNIIPFLGVLLETGEIGQPELLQLKLFVDQHLTAQSHDQNSTQDLSTSTNSEPISPPMTPPIINKRLNPVTPATLRQRNVGFGRPPFKR